MSSEPFSDRIGSQASKRQAKNVTESSLHVFFGMTTGDNMHGMISTEACLQHQDMRWDRPMPKQCKHYQKSAVPTYVNTSVGIAKCFESYD